jgi:hypothetical protein
MPPLYLWKGVFFAQKTEAATGQVYLLNLNDMKITEEIQIRRPGSKELCPSFSYWYRNSSGEFLSVRYKASEQASPLLIWRIPALS